MVTATVIDDDDAAAAAAAAAATAASQPVYGHIQPGTRVFLLRLPWKEATMDGVAGDHREIFATIKRRVEARGIFGGRREKMVKVTVPLATAIHESLQANAVVLQIVFDYYNALVRVYYVIPEQKAAEPTGG
jgi:hypothetical protein